MIQSKADLREYMEADRIHLGYEYKKPKIRDIVWRYEIYLRKSEYYNNCLLYTSDAADEL